MNIFILDEDPAVAASYHCDQHLNKMILESAQMLSSAVFSLVPYDVLHKLKPPIYKPSYPRHPCNIWLTRVGANTVDHSKDYQILFNRWTYLYVLARKLNSTKLSLPSSAGQDHGSIEALDAAYNMLRAFGCSYDYAVPRFYKTPHVFTKAMPEVFKMRYKGNDPATTVSAYRAYYLFKHKQWIAEGKKPMTWKNRSVPEWFSSALAT
jgi:hypothetical protein